MDLRKITIALALLATCNSSGSRAENASPADDVAEAAAIIGKNEYYSESGQFTCPDSTSCYVPLARVNSKKSLTTRHLSCLISHERLIDGFGLGRGPKKNRLDPGSGAGLEKPAVGGTNGNYFTGVNQDIVYKVPGGYFPIFVLFNSAGGPISVTCVLAGDLK